MTSQSSISDPHLDDNTSQFDDQSSTYPRTSAATQPSDSQMIAEPGAACGMATPTSSSGKADKAGIDARTKISNLLKDKAREWTAVVEKRNGPLRLLDLPMDVLKEIVKEVTHTNDLTSLALTHSALHNLAIPHIYSRFDIVWPDAHATSDPRTGVDALTYGLATLCMGDALSGAGQSQSFTCKHCGTQNVVSCDHSTNADARSTTRRLGNSYPQFTRKFSLGNGPTDWVQEYLITKESGKMLGTLVALAVAKMVNLESFSWDMPTGVLRDVWLALSSLQDKSPNQECRLERVWVRWHDNSEAIHLSSSQSSTVPGTTTQQMLSGTSMSSIGWILTPDLGTRSPNISQPLAYSQSRVEYPTLSVLPPLKSLSVLDIDEVEYLDEMSVLIERSKDKLRELRIGIATKAIHRDFALPWDGAELQQVDHEAKWPGASRIGEKRLGGVLGIILGRIFDIRKKPRAKTEKKARSSTPSTSLPPNASTPNASSTIQNPASEIAENGLYNWDYKESADSIVPGVAFNVEAGSTLGNVANHEQLVSSTLHAPHSDMDSLTALIAAHQFTSENDAVAQNVGQTEIPSDIPAEPPLRRSQSSSGRQAHFTEMSSSVRERLDGKLRLQTLELERVPLSVVVLQRAFDWSVLTNLTILDCPQHEKFWSMLRRHFAPTPIGNHLSSKHNGQVQYHLNLRKVHTDAASPALISFLKETLAPNTLETLFLQDRKRGPNSTVTIDAIYRGPLKRHRSSLKKLLLDSSDRIPRGPTSSVDSTKWKAWMPNRDVLNFITSGRMNSLRELSIAIDYKDWHHFLQRLPQIPHLRSLNVPYIAEHVTSNFDPRELALQIVDVIVLRPEVELCYMGVSHKCFEILENRPHEETHTPSSIPALITDDEDEEGSEDEEEDDDDDDADDDNGTAIAGIDPDETESDSDMGLDDDGADSDDDSWDGDSDADGKDRVRLRLREILFYDDKIAIFKARHGRL